MRCENVGLSHVPALSQDPDQPCTPSQDDRRNCSNGDYVNLLHSAQFSLENLKEKSSNIGSAWTETDLLFTLK